MNPRIQAALCALRTLGTPISRLASAVFHKTPRPYDMLEDIIWVQGRQQGKTMLMDMVLFENAVKTHDTADGRRVVIHLHPDKYTDRRKITVTRRLPYHGGPILQRTLKERFISVNAAMRYAKFVLGITEWNGQ